jgi:outer membrane protein assembly factor BamB
MMEIEGTNWRFAESPLVDGDRVIVTPGVADAALVALDKSTGKEIWRTTMPALGEAGADGAGYSSVVISDGAGVRQYVQLLGRGAIGVEAATGKFLWGYNRVANNVANIPTPVVDGDHVFVSTGYGTGAALLELHKTETGVAAKEVYFLAADTFQNHHGGMILDGGYLYAGTAHNKGFPIALRIADGSVAWGPQRNQGQGSAAVAFADGHLYFRYQDGRVVLFEATPEGYREKGTFMIPDVAQFSWAHPVIADGKLYLREQGSLYCYDLQAPPKADAAAKAGR